MSNKKYPAIGRVFKHKKNTQAKCRCGEIGRYKIDIKWNYMRGDDETVWACETHKNDLNFLAEIGEGE